MTLKIKKTIDIINVISYDLYKNGKRIGWIQHWLKRDTQLGRSSKSMT